jgi:hypothetical protein
MMIETTCMRCGRLHTPTLDDCRRGFLRICPACRLGPKRPHGHPLRLPGVERREREAA